MTDDLHSLAAAYALDALDPVERRRFEAHYPECPTCRDEVSGFRETAARLPASTPAALPADLKARVMAEVAGTRQLPPRVAETPSAPRRAPLITLAAAVVVVALVGFAFVLSRSGGDPADQELAQVLSAPDAVTVALEGDSDATLRVVYSASQDRAVLVGADLEQVPDDETYQLWTLAGSEPSSAGVFRPTGDGDVISTVAAPGVSPDAWAVTVEPDGGSPAPTGEILYQGVTV
jgi:anti-sigma-K factor RskA